MSDDKKYSLRDMVLAQREAYMAGSDDRARRGMPHSNGSLTVAARERYPLPVVTRPRVVTDPHDPNWENCVIDGRVQRKSRFLTGALGALGEWGDCIGTKWTPDRLRLWADLVANPTEEVEDDGQSRAPGNSGGVPAGGAQ